MRPIIKNSIFLLLLSLPILGLAQPKGGLVALGNGLRMHMDSLKAHREDSITGPIAQQMEQLITSAYRGVAGIGPKLDSIPNLGQTDADDGTIRLINWNTLNADGVLRYHCVVLHKVGKNMIMATVLRDSTDVRNVQDQRNLPPEAWYGALYYRIVSARHKKKIYHLLLGWDGKDQLSNRKVIDVLSFQKGRPMLGQSILKTEKKLLPRLVFEYAEDVTMMLNWDENLRMVVMDHLAPKEPYLRGNYQFYGPDMSYDALEFEAGKWLLMPDIDVRNRGDRGKKFNAPK